MMSSAYQHNKTHRKTKQKFHCTFTVSFVPLQFFNSSSPIYFPSVLVIQRCVTSLLLLLYSTAKNHFDMTQDAERHAASFQSGEIGDFHSRRSDASISLKRDSCSYLIKLFTEYSFTSPILCTNWQRYFHLTRHMKYHKAIIVIFPFVFCFFLFSVLTQIDIVRSCLELPQTSAVLLIIILSRGWITVITMRLSWLEN